MTTKRSIEIEDRPGEARVKPPACWPFTGVAQAMFGSPNPVPRWLGRGGR